MSSQKLVPGPGSYSISDTIQHDVVKKDAPRCIIGSQKRDSPNKKDKIPGPGSYNFQTIIGNDGPQQSIRIKTAKSSKLNFVPGPGAYTPRINFQLKHHPEFKIGTAQRTSEAESRMKTNKTPGPSQYDAKSFMLRKEPTWVIGSESRDHANKLMQQSRLPGPGSYNTQQNIFNGPKYVMAMKYKRKNSQANPGPGQYSSKTILVQQSSPTCKIGTAQRMDNTRSQTTLNPGPSTYQPRTRPTSAAPCYGFGTAGRSGANFQKKFVLK